MATRADGRQPWHRQRRRTTAQRSVVRHPQRQTEQADDGADQTLRLSIGEAEHSAQRQRREDRQRRITGLATWCRPRRRYPSRDCVIGKPHRQTATLTQAGFVGRPVGDLVLLSRNVVAAILVQLERHKRHPQVKEGGRFPTLGSPPPLQADPCTTLLGASNFTYAEARWTQSLPEWIGCPVGAVAHMGGGA